MFCNNCGQPEVSGSYCNACGNSLKSSERVPRRGFSFSLHSFILSALALVIVIGIVVGIRQTFSLGIIQNEISSQLELSENAPSSAASTESKSFPQDKMMSNFEKAAERISYSLPKNSTSVNSAQDVVNSLENSIKQLKRQWNNYDCPVSYPGGSYHANQQATLQAYYNEAISMNDLMRAAEIQRQMNNDDALFERALNCSYFESKLSKLNSKLRQAQVKLSSAQNANNPKEITLSSYKTQLWKVSQNLDSYTIDKSDELLKITNELHNYFGIPKNLALDILRESSEAQ